MQYLQEVSRCWREDCNISWPAQLHRSGYVAHARHTTAYASPLTYSILRLSRRPSLPHHHSRHHVIPHSPTLSLTHSLLIYSLTCLHFQSLSQTYTRTHITSLHNTSHCTLYTVPHHLVSQHMTRYLITSSHITSSVCYGMKFRIRRGSFSIPQHNIIIIINNKNNAL